MWVSCATYLTPAYLCLLFVFTSNIETLIPEQKFLTWYYKPHASSGSHPEGHDPYEITYQIFALRFIIVSKLQ